MIQFDSYFSDGLVQPPTSCRFAEPCRIWSAAPQSPTNDQWNHCQTYVPGTMLGFEQLLGEATVKGEKRSIEQLHMDFKHRRLDYFQCQTKQNIKKEVHPTLICFFETNVSLPVK